MAIPSPAVSPLRSLEVESLVVTQYASLPGSGTVAAVGGIYTATGSENPAGFPVAFAALSPAVVPPASYVAMVAVSAAAGLVASATAPGSWTGTGISVQTGAQLAAGDTVVVILVPT
jgi:hypothetical protein